MSSSGSSFQRVYTGWSGHLGKIAPLVMTISAPQQTLLYTPKFSFTLPFCGTVPPTHLHLRTDKNAFSMAYQANWITTRGQNAIFKRPKMSAVREADASTHD